MKSCHKAATGSQHKEEVYALRNVPSPNLLPPQMSPGPNGVHQHSPFWWPQFPSRSTYPPKKWGKNHLWDMWDIISWHVRQSRRISLCRSSFLQHCRLPRQWVCKGWHWQQYHREFHHSKSWVTFGYVGPHHRQPPLGAIAFWDLPYWAPLKWFGLFE